MKLSEILDALLAAVTWRWKARQITMGKLPWVICPVRAQTPDAPGRSVSEFELLRLKYVSLCNKHYCCILKEAALLNSLRGYFPSCDLERI